MRKVAFNRLLGPLSGFVARQLGEPHGVFGRVVMTRLLNRGNRKLIEAALAALAVGPGDDVLDVGFGGGVALELALRAGARHVAGVDPSEAAVAAVARRLRRPLRRGQLGLLCARATELPFASRSLDKVLSTNTIYFWPDLAPPVAELARVLAPGGRLVLGFSDADKLRGFGAITRHGFTFHERGAIAGALERAGLAQVALRALHGGSTEGDYVAVAERPAR
ncbi:MAG: class I SAM-dependent methyltransferase [Polyangiaceae bacterium]|nr:class I SAM-dependent methyltransferase [Polyangiaceae bacterium]